jgi:ATP phosphoribosyltransferase
VLIKQKGLSSEAEKTLARLLFRMESVKKAKKNKYVLLNAPNDKIDTIISLLPGMKSPTVLPLAKEGWSSVHSVIAESDFWDIIEQLKAAGAEGILVVPIEKMIL